MQRTGDEGTFTNPEALDTVQANELRQPSAHALVGRAWRRARWFTTTLSVTVGSFFFGVIGEWAASYIVHVPFASSAFVWDSHWYYAISQTGYVSGLPTSPDDAGPLRDAFFPGLPLLERGVHDVVGGSPLRTTMLIGFVGLLASCLLLRLLVSSMFGEDAGWRATVLFAFFPGSYVFFFGYSEAIFIPLAIVVLYALHRRWYLLAGLASALASGTRLLGVALVFACAIAALLEFWAPRRHRRPQWPRLAAAGSSPVIGLTGVVAFVLYLHARTGSFTAIFKAERVGWHNRFSISEPYDAFKAFADHPLVAPWVTLDAIGTIVVVGCFVWLAVEGWKRLPLAQIGFTVVILLAWLFTTNTGAWFRFVETAFPVLSLMGFRLGQRWYPVFACAGAALLGILVVLFTAHGTFAP